MASFKSKYVASLVWDEIWKMRHCVEAYSEEVTTGKRKVDIHDADALRADFVNFCNVAILNEEFANEVDESLEKEAA